MSLKTRVVGLNEFLTTLYASDMRLSVLLEQLGLEAREVSFLRSRCPEQVVDGYITAVLEDLRRGGDGERLAHVVSRRFGLDGEPPETLESLGQRLGVTRERVRQIEKKALRRSQHKANLHRWEVSLVEVAQRLLNGDEVTPKSVKLP